MMTRKTLFNLFFQKIAPQSEQGFGGMVIPSIQSRRGLVCDRWFCRVCGINSIPFYNFLFYTPAKSKFKQTLGF